MLKKTATTLALCVLLTAVFTLYAQPDFMVQMANQLWACF
ncbi:hypothetical protein AEP_01102 [Curvibacter sp. AEP1-3]|nr:hypothetical protein AEP_01102 [Curvibacter sp. AEP1-3]